MLCWNAAPSGLEVGELVLPLEMKEMVQKVRDFVKALEESMPEPRTLAQDPALLASAVELCRAQRDAHKDEKPLLLESSIERVAKELCAEDRLQETRKLLMGKDITLSSILERCGHFFGPNTGVDPSFSAPFVRTSAEGFLSPQANRPCAFPTRLSQLPVVIRPRRTMAYSEAFRTLSSTLLKGRTPTSPRQQRR